ncbi:hypothetical protein PP935_gp119 [Rhizobium phage RHph_N34]|uniref:Uncharacterized protein n=1 Tax=Rhizobium phage RHph_N34 TaxID=2509586 RepID=A0A7S5RIY1_9CAUD|nr:hypothetical protein PP935_gp119 [Rhizobium phage RHph_N34]QIG73894.1 hypothetical protein EVC06_119 [Rhizobium phage RHph_N34]
MTKSSIHPKKLSSKFAARDNINGYILRVDYEREDRDGNPIVMDIVAFEWHSIISHDILGKAHMIYGMRAPVKHVWDAIDAFGRPDKAILTDGTWIWVMSSYCKDGKIDRLEGGNSSPFTIISRDTKLSEEEI